MTDERAPIGVPRFLLLLAWVGLCLAVVFTVWRCRSEPEGGMEGAREPEVVPSADPVGERTRRRVGRTRPPTGTDDAAAAPDKLPAATTPPPTVTETSPPWLDLALARHAIEGRVVGPDGVPREGVIVSLVSTWLDAAARDALLRRDGFSRHLVSMAESAADGSFRVGYVEGGDRRLVAGPLESPLATTAVRPGAFHELVVPEELRSLAVTVLDADGAPLPQTHVWGAAAFPWGPSPLKSTLAKARAGRADDGGVARIDVPAGRIELRVHRQGSTQMPQVFVAVVGAAGEAATTVRLAREVVVRGRVVDAVTGEPVRGAFAKDMSRTALSAFTGADGVFELPMPLEPRVGLTLAVEAPGYAEQSALALVRDEPTDDTVCEIEVRLHRTASLRLRCVDERGAALELVTVIARSTYLVATRPIRSYGVDVQSVPSARGGRVFLERLHPGDDLPLQVVVLRGGVVLLDRELPPLAAGEERDLGELVMASGRTLAGTVRDADGHPVAGALVIAVPRSGREEDDARRAGLAVAALTGEGRRSETGVDGAFAIAALPPGLCDLLVVRPRPGLLVEALAITSGSDPAPLDLRLPRVVAIPGRVLEADGSPAAGATLVHPIPGPVPLNAVDTVSTDAQGRFTLPGFAVDADPFDVIVLTAAGERSTHRIDPGRGEAVLRLE